MRSIVAVARSESYTREAMRASMRTLLDHLEPPLPAVVRHGDRVLVKVNMGCKGGRAPARRYTSHPTYVEALVEALDDCGARVVLGDDVSRTARYEAIWRATGMLEVAARTGATLVDFVAAGGLEMRGFLRVPRTHFITRLVRDVDVTINAASCRSHSGVVLSGAIKNMFGTVLGGRRYRVHQMFPDPSDFAEVLVDIFRIINPALSFVDMTTVRAGHGTEGDAIHPVGLLLGGADAASIDTVAAEAIGYAPLPLWTSFHGARVGLGRSCVDEICVKGRAWETFVRKALPWPVRPVPFDESAYDRVSRWLNHTILRPRPVIASEACTGCGKCSERCPARAIAPTADGRFRIDHRACADCNCCVVLCETAAVRPTFVGLGRIARGLTGSLPSLLAGSSVPIRPPVSDGGTAPRERS